MVVREIWRELCCWLEMAGDGVNNSPEHSAIDGKFSDSSIRVLPQISAASEDANRNIWPSLSRLSSWSCFSFHASSCTIALAWFERPLLVKSGLPTITSSHCHTRSELGALQGQVSLKGSLRYLSDTEVRGSEELALLCNLESLVDSEDTELQSWLALLNLPTSSGRV